MTLSSTMSIYTLCDLLWADFWDRFPELKFSLTEGDIGWIPYFLWRAEHVHDRHSGWTRHQFGASGGPTEVFREHVLCCFINDPVGVKLLDEFNLDNVCWESDYPHSDGTWPNAPEEAAKILAGVHRRRRSTRSPTRTRWRTTSSIPFAAPPQGAVHGRPPSGPSHPTSTS